jgi:hypothetical protein
MKQSMPNGPPSKPPFKSSWKFWLLVFFILLVSIITAGHYVPISRKVFSSDGYCASTSKLKFRIFSPYRLTSGYLKYADTSNGGLDDYRHLAENQRNLSQGADNLCGTTEQKAVLYLW